VASERAAGERFVMENWMGRTSRFFKVKREARTAGLETSIGGMGAGAEGSKVETARCFSLLETRRGPM